MSNQLSRIENKIDRIDEKITELKESRGEQSKEIAGHGTQLALLWTALFLVVGSVVAAYLKL